MKTLLKKWAIVPIIALIVIVVDQWTKGLIEQNIPLGGSYVPFPKLEPYFKLVHWPNTGTAFGLFQGQGSLFAVIAVVVIVAVLVYTRYLPTDSLGVRVCLGLQLGGAIGNNLFDRLQLGHVTDFLLFTLPVGNRVLMWPAWNVADACIVVGTILLAILLLRSEGKKSDNSVSSSDVSNAAYVSDEGTGSSGALYRNLPDCAACPADLSDEGTGSSGASNP